MKNSFAYRDFPGVYRVIFAECDYVDYAFFGIYSYDRVFIALV
jgi:hypothetical protein